MKITGIYGLMMIALVASFLSTGTEAERPVPFTCEGFSDPNAVCNISDDGLSKTVHCLHGYRYIGDSPNCLPEQQSTISRTGLHTCEYFPDPNAVCTITDDGWGSIIRCRDGYIQSWDSTSCVPEGQTGVNSQGRKTCEGFSDANGVCQVNPDSSDVSIYCKPGYVFPLGSEKCISKANVRGYYTCDEFSAANSICRVIENGWALYIRCRDGYVPTPHSNNCIRKDDYHRGARTCDGFNDPDAICEVTDRGWGREIRCRDGYIYSQNLDKCIPENHFDANSQGRKTCEGFFKVNAVCELNSDGTAVTIHCDPGYVLPLNSDKCISKADVRGYYTCEGFSAANAVCEVVDNGWAKHIRCFDGYVPSPHSGNCILKDASHRGLHSCENLPDPNVVCTIIDNGSSGYIRCRDGYIYSQDLDICVPENQADAHPLSRKTCEGFADVNGICTVNADGSDVSHHCKPGYVLPLGSDTCLSTADVRGYYTCDDFSTANAICEVIHNGWALHIRCLDGYVRTPHSGNCIRKNDSNA